MTSPISLRLLRSRSARPSLSRSVKLLSLDVFGVAFEPTFLDEEHQYLLVADLLGRRHPGAEGAYPQARLRAEANAREASKQEDGGEPSLASIGDHLQSEFVKLGLHDPGRCADDAIDIEIDLRRTLGRPNPDALELHLQARRQGAATALVADTPLPRDLIAHIARSCGYQPDHVLVSSDLGVGKGSGLYQRLVERAQCEPGSILHLGPDPVLDLATPTAAGIQGHLSPALDDVTLPPLLLGRTAPRGLGSIALQLAHRRLQRAGWKLTDADVGYYAAGPLLFGFTLWVAAQIDAIDPDHVVFGPRAGVVDQALSALRPDLSTKRHRLDRQPGEPRKAVGHLVSSAKLDQAARVLAVDLGMFDDPCALLMRELGEASPEVTGAYLGRFGAPETHLRTWAFGGTGTAPIAELAARRPEILEALIHDLPPSVQDVSPNLRPYHSTGRQVAKSALAFVDDMEPWVRLHAGRVSPALLEPALRVMTQPIAAEAKILGTYPPRAGDPTASSTLVSEAGRSSPDPPTGVGTGMRASDMLWSEAIDALGSRRPTRRLRDPRRR